MYNHASIEAFIDKVNSEASAAAQAVYDKHQDELIQRVQNQLRPGDKIHISMGSASLTKANGEDAFGSKLASVLANTQYSHVEAGFSMYIIGK